MLPFLGDIIQKHPAVVVIAIIMITIGLSLFIPAIEFKTDFEEFTPDDTIVKANTRIQEYFGEDQQLIFIYATKEDSPHVLTSNSIREIYQLQKELEQQPEVVSSFSIVTFLDMICLIEYGSSLMDCTDNQIETALNDLLTNYSNEELSLLKQVDPNENIDYKRFPIFSKGKSIDSADVKNCYISKTEEQITFSIEVYDLQDLESSVSPVFPKVNVMEWYVAFKNRVTPFEDLNISYKIAAHLEPQQAIWEIGDGLVDNLKTILQQIKNKTLLDSYKKEVYLWIQPADQSFSLPLRLNTGKVSFNKNDNRIELSVSLDELGKYGIAPQFGSIALPAKLSNFQIGTRYYQTSVLNLGGGRITANTSKLIETLFRFKSKPLLGKISESIFNKFGILNWEEFEDLYDMMESGSMIPETMALKDIESSWINADSAPDETIILDTFFPIIPAFYQDVQITVRSLLSTDVERNNNSLSTLIFLELTPTKDYDEIININKKIIKDINRIDKKLSYIKTQATGTGISTAEINDLTTEANKFIAPAIFIIIVAVLFINFRRISYVVLPMLSLVVSTIWLFGAMALLDISFNVISIALVPLILGLGVDYSVHLFHNYRVELQKGKTPGEAIKNSVTEIGTAMFLAMFTTVIAFLSFLTASVPPIRDFGILLALGVSFTFITSITLLAALRYLLDKRSTVEITQKEQGLIVQNIMRIISEKVLCYKKTIVTIMILLTIFFLIGASQIDTGYDIDQFAPTDTPAFELFDVIVEEFPFSSQTQNYILLEGNVATVETIKGIKQSHEKMKDDKYIAKNKDGSLKVISIYSYIEQIVENNRSVIDQFKIDPDTLIPEKDSDVKALFDYLYDSTGEESASSQILTNRISDSMNFSESSFDLFNGEIRTVLYKENNVYTAVLIRMYLDSSFSTIEGNVQDELEILRNEIKGDVTSYGSVEAVVTGTNIINLEITNNLTESQVLSTIISIILAAMVLILVYRNLSLGLIALIPVGISIIWILGTMYFIGYSLNVLTITVTSITIGIGIDYAIHVTERFRFIVDKTGDITQAVCETISHTGGALLIAALTTALGFIILVFAPIPPQQQFGLILSITIIYSFLTSIFLLPLVIYHWAMRQYKKKGFVITKTPGKNNHSKIYEKNKEKSYEVNYKHK